MARWAVVNATANLFVTPFVMMKDLPHEFDDTQRVVARFSCTLLAVRQKTLAEHLDSGLKIKHDPCWGVVARVFLPTRPSVNTAVHEPDRQIR